MVCSKSQKGFLLEQYAKENKYQSKAAWLVGVPFGFLETERGVHLGEGKEEVSSPAL